ncbi:elongation factor P maturation arginine rhamnosyltransferase EarP [Paludibacterium paludis]|uniref:Protein-arginine rhamnosyltransferase n=1 Tax=Paludibacterium paludis TaxID=1225769 RepID=A0A918P071_9NEIS|nr:elongation factor P maturation arginine rhamnosyltransferase EarP [Paludibacterium paludis]GGY10710.1 hypothetical protein GCM10011289_11850 [Paludibacterium paludis]
MLATPALNWDIYCKVIDNFGDIGVTWRLAKQLVREHGHSVRLWVDDLAAAQPLIRDLDPGLADQTCQGIRLMRWDDTASDAVPGDVVVEAFACDLPESVLDAMAARRPAPVWINLEYLSAEDWVEGCHGMRSVHPARGLVKTFYFPGFGRATGGLLMERYVPEAVRLAQASRQPPFDVLNVSLFSYPNPALASLLQAWREHESPIHCRIPEGRVLESLEPLLGTKLRPGERLAQDALTLEILPFTDQEGYDRILWNSDFNIVRGEDSFVRAQWAERPFLWHIYPQEDDIHLVKLDAFLRRYTTGLSPDAAAALIEAQQCWNRSASMSSIWRAMSVHLPELAMHSHRWAAFLRENGDLAGRLVQFVQNQIQ